ncbi:MAG TPA: type II CRISPR RNA-guided endonuclease Cas9 [Candidatus Cloacimonadota bacterium]|nr:type II CRISPR RNA-guided endonuclease Cas9 [Candidatus Cloacimonadota bacterium]
MKEKERKIYRLGIDMGSTSLGWCMLELDQDSQPCNVINMGVRIFPDGRDDKSKEPLSVKRRTVRGARRNHDRYLLRRKALLNFFDREKWLPQTEPERHEVFLLDPITLRKEALDRQLTLPELARAFIHLAKRRGFKSNRKGNKEDKNFSAYKIAMENLENKIKESNARTLGEYLWLRNKDLPSSLQHQRKSIKFRYEKSFADEERIFPTRKMVTDEFDLIWDTQAAFNPLLTPSLKAELKNIIFYQRDLQPQEVGNCLFEIEEKRAPKASPIFQEFRLRQDINHLKLIKKEGFEVRELNNEEREKLFQKLNMKKEVAFAALRQAILGKDEYDKYRFNLEEESKPKKGKKESNPEAGEEEKKSKGKLKGNLTNYSFLRFKQLGAYWMHLEQDKQDRIISLLLDDSLTDEACVMLLQEEGMPGDLARQALDVDLPSGYGSLSKKAMLKIMPFLRQGMIYSEACSAAGYNHSGFYNGEVFDQGNLPYYGELLTRYMQKVNRKTYDEAADQYGKINNPTVHIALNQLRKLINALTLRYGAPAEIHVELAREVKLNAEQNKEINNRIKKNREENERIAKELEKAGLEASKENITKYKLWQELSPDPFDKRCVYCGRQISFLDLFTPEIHIEHILPKSRTYDDSYANKTISHLSCNIDKGEKSPWEAFGNMTGKYDWQSICIRADNLPENKKWRFLPDAMDRFADENELIGRMLNDTRYMTRIAAEYLQYVTGKLPVAVNGKLTSDLREKWKLNSLLGEGDAKERTDHRHHAIDAFVIALTDRSMVKRYADAVKRDTIASNNHSKRFLQDLGDPYPNFNRQRLQSMIDKLVVSYKPDQPNPSLLRSRRQTGGALLEETAFGYLGPDPKNPKYSLYSVRKKVSELEMKDIETVISKELRESLLNLANTCSNDKEFKAKLPAWAEEHKVKKIKTMVTANPKTMIPIKDKNGRIYKYYQAGENLFADIYQIYLPKKNLNKWGIEICNSYAVHQPDFMPEWKKLYPMAKLIMRVYKNDIVAFTNEEGKRELRRVKKMTKDQIYLRELNIAKKPKGKEDIGEAFSPNQLRLKNAAKAGIDIMGRWFDPLGGKNASDRN